MFVARWIVDVRFGHKDEYVAKLRRWQSEIGSKLGWKARVLTGSIGAGESRVEMEIPVESLDALEKAWAKLGQSDAHKALSRELEPLVVSGSNRWEIFRPIDL